MDQVTSDRLLPAFLIARELMISKQLVYSWVKSEKLKPASKGDDGRALYSLQAAAVVERDTRRSPLSHRKPARSHRRLAYANG